MIRDFNRLVVKPFEVPHFKGVLDPHQPTAAVFFVNNVKTILADSVGMGKSVSLVAALCFLKYKYNRGPFILVVPTSKVYDWQDEILKFSDLSCLVIAGDSQTRSNVYEAFQAGHADVLVLNYDLFRRDVSILSCIPCDGLFYDDSQIRNANSALFAATQTFVATHPNIWGGILDATPVHNNIFDLWVLFASIGFYPFGSDLEFKFYYCIEQEMRLQTSRGVRRVRKIVGVKNMEHLLSIITPYILSRTRSVAVATEIISVPMSASQRLYYDSAVSGILVIANQLKYVELLAKFTYLQEICTSPYLVDANQPCDVPKLVRAVEIIKSLNGKQCLVFSIFKMSLELMSQLLSSAGISYVFYTGDQSKEERHQIRNDYVRGKWQVMLMTKAGERGINLETGCAVIFLDRMTNPQRNTQIVGRLTRRELHPVKVFHLVMENSIDARILSILEQKQLLFDNLMNPIRAFSADELKAML